MSLYTKDAIKEVAPNTTLQKCINIFDRFKFMEFAYTHELVEGKYDTFGIYTGNFSISPYALYERFPDVFPYMQNKQHINWQNSNGKGLSYEQCMASLYVEMIERLSIKLFEQKIKTFGGENRKVYGTQEYLDYLKNNIPELIDHFKDQKFGFSFPDSGVACLKVKDIAADKELFFPEDVLFDTMGTNGFTAGNTPEEAIIGGIFEIVERYTQTVFCTKEIEASKVSHQSIIERFPELENALDKSRHFFDKYDVVDVSIEINGIKFYSYFVRTEFDETGHKAFSSGGCHLDQRVAIIRAVSEGIQAFEERITDADKTTTRQQGWGKSRIFSQYFIDRIYGRIDNLPEKDLQAGNDEFDSIHEIYELSLKAFKSVIVLDCTNENFDIPSQIIYIPELFPKTYIWPSLFHVGVTLLSEIKFPNSIEGLEKLFFETEAVVDEDINERNNLYFNLIFQLQNKEIEEFIRSNWEGYNPEIFQLEVRTKYFYEEVDPDGFSFFNAKYNDGSDLEYLIDSYSRMGCLSLAKGLFDELGNEGLKSSHIERYKKLGDKLIELGANFKALLVFKQIAAIDEADTEASEKISQLESLISQADGIISKIYDRNSNTFFDIKVGDEFEGGKLIEIKQEAGNQLDVLFDIEKAEFSFSVFTTEPEDYVIETKNGLYIEHLYDLMSKKEKRFLKRFTKHISKY